MLVLGRSRCDNSMPTFVWRPVTNFVTKPPNVAVVLCHRPFFRYRYLGICNQLHSKSRHHDEWDAVASFFPSFWDDINQPPTSHLVDPEVCAPWCCREFFHDRANDGEWPELSGPHGASKKCPRRRREAGGGADLRGGAVWGGGGIISHPMGMSPYPTNGKFGKLSTPKCQTGGEYVILPRRVHRERM